MKNSRLVSVLLVLFVAISTIYLLILGYYNTLLLDDYGFVAKLRNTSVWAFAWDQYINWQGRIVPFLLSAACLKLMDGCSTLLGYTIAQLLLGWGSFYLFLNLIYKELSTVKRLVIAMSLANILILSLFSISTYYWPCCMGYIYSLWMTLLLVYVICRDNLNRIASCLIIVLLSAYIGQISEIYSPVLMCIGAAIMLYQIKSCGWKEAMGNSKSARLTLSVVTLAVFFLIMLLAPGNSNRLVSDRAAFSIKDYLGMLFFCGAKLMLRLHYFFLAFGIAAFAGNSVGPHERQQLICSWRSFFISLVLLVVLIVLSTFPCFVAAGFFPPDRSITFVSLFVLLFVCFWGVVVGQSIKRESVCTMLNIVSMCMIIYVGVWCYIDGPIARDYHDEIVAQHEYLQDLQNDGNQETIVVSPIPFKSKFDPLVIGGHDFTFCSYFPYERYELSEDPLDWKNVGLRKYLNLDFDVVQK